MPALAGVIGIGALCEVALCEPARADVVAFANTVNLTATLYLFDGGTQVAAVSTQVGAVPTIKFQGYISNSDTSPIPSIGGPNGSNTS